MEETLPELGAVMFQMEAAFLPMTVSEAGEPVKDWMFWKPKLMRVATETLRLSETGPARADWSTELAPAAPSIVLMEPAPWKLKESVPGPPVRLGTEVK